MLNDFIVMSSIFFFLESLYNQYGREKIEPVFWLTFVVSMQLNLGQPVFAGLLVYILYVTLKESGAVESVSNKFREWYYWIKNKF